jgi:mlo protein
VDPFVGTQLKPHDALFWFDKPQLLLWLIHFISFQNAFEIAVFIWSWWKIKAHTCFMKDPAVVYTCLISGILVQFWRSYAFTQELVRLINQNKYKIKM